MAIIHEIITLCLLILPFFSFCIAFDSIWQYKCEDNKCAKYKISWNHSDAQAFAVCQLFCGEFGPLWPQPNGKIILNKDVAHLNHKDIVIIDFNEQTIIGKLLIENVNNLKKNLLNQAPEEIVGGGIGLNLIFIISKKMFVDAGTRLNVFNDESYKLKIEKSNDKVNATIYSSNFFGARNALETLSQLIVLDDLQKKFKIASDVYIEDAPAYLHRGIMIDTARNYIDKETIKRTIDAMGMSKLNSLHWHIVDSQSFPYVSRTWPQLAEYGAYSSKKVYTGRDIQEIVEYGILNGVHVYPEFDTPSHVGEGWQYFDENYVLCFNKRPWDKYCYEPPCGVLNPTADRVYEILEMIYGDMLNDFKARLFHMGGDEVKDTCWLEDKGIQNWISQNGWNETNYFLPLWNYFQKRAHEKLVKANGGKAIQAVLWSSDLTKADNLLNLDPKLYIIQVWSSSYDESILNLLKNNYRVIISYYDQLYLDCGYSSWLGEGNNWCSPYKGWQKIYNFSPRKILEQYNLTDKFYLILGAETALWSEQVDSAAFESKVWPRSAALAERLWSEPISTWEKAQHRFMVHRQRMIERGIKSDAQQPEWCLYNQDQCFNN